MRNSAIAGVIFAILLGGYFYFSSKASADDRESFLMYVCPKIEPNPRSCKGNGTECVPVPFSVDCECSFETFKNGMSSEHFSKFLLYAESAVKSNARRVTIPESDIKQSVGKAFRSLQDTCITEQN